MANIQPRFIRYRDAPDYLGMSKSVFATDVRPYLVEVPIGQRGVAFDRLDLDAWADQYKARNGRPMLNGEKSWEAQERGVSPSKTTVLEPSIKSGAGKESSPGSDRSRRKRQNGGSPPKSPGAKRSERANVDDVIALCSRIAQGAT